MYRQRVDIRGLFIRNRRSEHFQTSARAFKKRRHPVHRRNHAHRIPVHQILSQIIRRSRQHAHARRQKYDPITATANTAWMFYKKHGKNLEFVDRIDIKHHIYSPSELSALLRKAGWETLTFFGNLATQQPMTPLTSLNLVAKAA